MSSFFGNMRQKLKKASSFKTNAGTYEPAEPRGEEPESEEEDSQRQSEKTLTTSPADDAPPAYSEMPLAQPRAAVAAPSHFPAASTLGVPSAYAGSIASSAQSRREVLENIGQHEDQYAFLTTFDTVFLIDDSYSMDGPSWREVKELLERIAPICTKYDEDGIDVFFLNHRNEADPTGGYRNITSASMVKNIFRRVTPSGGTPTGRRIRQIIKPYLRDYRREIQNGADADETELKPVNMIVVTDGCATDDPETDIADIARQLDELHAPGYQVGLQFFQIGTIPSATAFLEHLDDSLSKQKQVRDIVDTVTWDGKSAGRPVMDPDTILKTVLGAVVARLDRMKQTGQGSRY